MFTIFQQGGIFMWPLLIIAISVVILSIKKAIDLFGQTEQPRKQLESGLNAIIFWGAISVIIGFLAHFWGMYMALQAISMASDISPAIVAQGFAVSLITILFGLLIFLFSGIMWLVLRWRYKKLVFSELSPQN